jgi:hypothetical protein
MADAEGSTATTSPPPSPSSSPNLKSCANLTHQPTGGTIRDRGHLGGDGALAVAGDAGHDADDAVPFDGAGLGALV